MCPLLMCGRGRGHDNLLHSWLRRWTFWAHFRKTASFWETAFDLCLTTTEDAPQTRTHFRHKIATAFLQFASLFIRARWTKNPNRQLGYDWRFCNASNFLYVTSIASSKLWVRYFLKILSKIGAFFRKFLAFLDLETAFYEVSENVGYFGSLKFIREKYCVVYGLHLFFVGEWPFIVL